MREAALRERALKYIPKEDRTAELCLQAASGQGLTDAARVYYNAMSLISQGKYQDALFYMGQSCEKVNNKDQAQIYYKKILSLPGKEEDMIKIKTRRALKALDGAVSDKIKLPVEHITTEL